MTRARKTSGKVTPEKPRRPRQTMLGLWEGLTIAQREAARRAAYRRVFDTIDGRVVLADILMSAGFLTARPPMDAIALAHGEGARWLVSEILTAAGVERAPLAMAIVADDLTTAFDVTF